MERDPNCSRDIHYEQCQAQFYERIGAEISEEWRKAERRKIYEAGKGEKRQTFDEERS